MMKLLKVVVVFYVWLFATTVLAQPPHFLNGNWQATYQDSKGRDRAADLTFSDKGSSWRDAFDPSKKNRGACHHEFPLVVEINTRGDIGLVVDPSDNIQGCGNHEMILHRVDDNLLEGTLKDGRPVKLVRR